MNQHFAIAAVMSAALGVASAASAGVYDPSLDYTISINDGDPFDVSGTPTTFSVTVPETGGMITGFSFEGTVFINPLGGFGAPWWTQLTITSPDGLDYIVGGNADFDTPWAFDSQGDSNPETYQHGLGDDAWGGDGLPDFALPDSTSAGVWEFTFVQTFGNATPEWSDVTITLHSIPGPGGLAMLGVALVGSRRRRRRA